MMIRLLLSVCLALTASPAQAEDNADTIIATAQKVQRIESAIQQIEMVLVSKNGARRHRSFEMKTKRIDGLNATYVRFSKPTDVAGTQLIVLERSGKSDEQILYLPALKRTNRIAGRAKKGAFMGSDFSYEDFDFSDDPKATHTLISSNDTTWVIDTKPGPESSYGRIRSTVSKSDHLPRQVEFFDAKDHAKKLLTIQQTATQNGAVLPTHSVMKNLNRGTSTELKVTEWQLNLPPHEIPNETFTIGFLERNG